MSAKIIDFPNRHCVTAPQPDFESLMMNLPLGFESAHCASARAMLGWSVEALAFRSGVSLNAIRRVESGMELGRVTMQALSYTLEAEGLIFFPNTQPLRAGNCRGATPDPKTRADYHLIE